MKAHAYCFVSLHIIMLISLFFVMWSLLNAGFLASDNGTGRFSLHLEVDTSSSPNFSAYKICHAEIFNIFNHLIIPQENYFPRVFRMSLVNQRGNTHDSFYEDTIYRKYFSCHINNNKIVWSVMKKFYLWQFCSSTIILKLRSTNSMMCTLLCPRTY